MLDISRLGYAGQVTAGSWIAEFRDVLDGCGIGNLGGVLMTRSQLTSEVLEAPCWRGDLTRALALAVGTVLLGNQMVE